MNLFFDFQDVISKRAWLVTCHAPPAVMFVQMPTHLESNLLKLAVEKTSRPTGLPAERIEVAS